MGFLMNFIKKNWKIIIIGALSGLTNGLLGAGGGIIITCYLARSLNEEQKKDNGIFANAVATMLPISILSIVFYILNGYVSIEKGMPSLFPSAIIGGIFGAFLLTKLNFKTVKILFSILVTISGFLMIFK